MNCSDVIARLSDSAEMPDAMADHLAACPECASWAEDDAQILRTWHASRPVEPSEDVWNALWSRVATELDAAQAPQVLPMPTPVRRYRPALFALGLAQAAAIVLAVYWLPGRHPGGSNPDTTPVVVAQKWEIEDGEDAYFREDDGTWSKDKDTGALDDSSSQASANLSMLNFVEGLAEVVPSADDLGSRPGPSKRVGG